MSEKETFDRSAIVEALRAMGHQVPNDVEIAAFGDSAEMADELGGLICDGQKTATAALLWDYEHDDELPPTAGDLMVTIDWNGNILALLRMTDVRVVPFNQVDAEFARDEGEGDLTLEYWRLAHWRFFSRVCVRIDREPTQTMPIVCQRFELLHP